MTKKPSASKRKASGEKTARRKRPAASGKASAAGPVPLTYARGQHHLTCPVHGAYGGPSGGGDIVAHFWAEYVDLPEDESMPVKDGVVRVPTDIRVSGVRREIVASLVMRPEVAGAVAIWLAQKVPGLRVEKVDE